MYRNLKLLALALFVSGCQTYGGTMMYSGSGSFENFAKARFECSKASSNQSSGGYLNEYGGGFSSIPTVNCGMMDACLASKGYIRSEGGSFDASSMQVRCSN